MNAPIHNPPADAGQLAAIKTRQQAAWSSGDYAVVGTTLQLVGELLAEACSTWPPATATPRWPPRGAAAG